MVEGERSGGLCGGGRGVSWAHVCCVRAARGECAYPAPARLLVARRVTRIPGNPPRFWRCVSGCCVLSIGACPVVLSVCRLVVVLRRPVSGWTHTYVPLCWFSGSGAPVFGHAGAGVWTLCLVLFRVSGFGCVVSASVMFNFRMFSTKKSVVYVHPAADRFWGVGGGCAGCGCACVWVAVGSFAGMCLRDGAWTE